MIVHLMVALNRSHITYLKFLHDHFCAVYLTEYLLNDLKKFILKSNIKLIIYRKKYLLNLLK